MHRRAFVSYRKATRSSRRVAEVEIGPGNVRTGVGNDVTGGGTHDEEAREVQAVVGCGYGIVDWHTARIEIDVNRGSEKVIELYDMEKVYG